MPPWNVFTLEPNRVTESWLEHRTDDDLRRLQARWPSGSCRGEMIFREIYYRERGA